MRSLPLRQTSRSLPRSPRELIAIVRQQLQAIPSIPPEESIALRVCVQAMVTVGILATDIAAETQMSLWAVPLSILGAAWSWKQRYNRNIPAKFLLALAMLGSLGLFFNNLLTSLNDTRLTLAELLIQVQVLHSFDLPRRKDLGYSMTIGLILIGVAGTLSQTMAFAPLLLLFLVFALPSLWLEYRSRLGLREALGGAVRASASQRLFRHFPWKLMGSLFAATLTIGLILFAAMPRVPGYQLRSFPVSADIPFQGQFDGRNVVRPGQGEGNGTGAGTGSSAPESGPGALDDTLYYGFSDRMNQNLRGSMEPQLVMRVRSQAPGFWRVMAFDQYTGQGWQVSDREATQTYKRSSWSYRFALPPIYSESQQQEVIQTYTLVQDLPGVIPALDRATFLYFPTQEVAVDREDAVRSPVALAEGLTYSVISFARQRDRTLLGLAGTDYHDRIRERYLQVPERIRDRVRQYTETVLAQAPNSPSVPYEKALYLAQYLKQTYLLPENPLDLPFLGNQEDLVESFLFRCAGKPQDTCTAGGYPDHFSTVLTIMLRSIGIPARLVVGFAPGEFNAFTGLYEVKNTDAYAMTEVYFPKHGWFAFDPIPGHEIVPPSPTEYQPFGVLQAIWSWVASWLPSPVAGFFSGIFNLIGRALTWILSQFGRGWSGLLLGSAALILGGLLGWLVWRGGSWWHKQQKLARLADADRLYRQMLEWSTRQGLPKHPAQTPWEYAQAARSRYPAVMAETIEAIVQAYMRWHYGGETVSVQAIAAQFETAKRLVKQSNP